MDPALIGSLGGWEEDTLCDLTLLAVGVHVSARGRHLPSCQRGAVPGPAGGSGFWRHLPGFLLAVEDGLLC